MNIWCRSFLVPRVWTLMSLLIPSFPLKGSLWDGSYDLVGSNNFDIFSSDDYWKDRSESPEDELYLVPPAGWPRWYIVEFKHSWVDCEDIMYRFMVSSGWTVVMLGVFKLCHHWCQVSPIRISLIASYETKRIETKNVSCPQFYKISR